MNPFRKSYPPFFQVFSGLLLLLAAAFILLNPHPVRANIATDGTVGPMQTLTGPDFIIPQDLGALRGQNLFHSFRTFGIDSGQSATFTGENSIANVISRVTGGEASHINGLLRSTIGQADFYFINPSGVVFGPRARVDVPAAFHVSTANELKFADGSSFSATDTGSSTLTQAAPEAFGFLGGQAGNIEINGSRFDFGAERTVSLSGGDITIQRLTTGTGLFTNVYHPRIASDGGSIYLTAVGEQSATVYPDDRRSSNAGGNLVLDGTRIDVRGYKDGRISIQSGNAFVAGGSVIESSNRGTTDAMGGIDVIINGDMRIRDKSQIRSDAEGGGRSGPVTISVSGQMELLEGSAIASSSFDDGGSPGGVYINAGKLDIDGHDSDGRGSRIISDMVTGKQGNAGTVSVKVNDLLQLTSGGYIRSDTLTKGNAGNVIVQAHTLIIDGEGIIVDGNRQVSSISCQSRSTGDGGTINIDIPGSIQISNGAAIVSNANSEGDAGNIIIKAGNLKVDGQGPDPSVIMNEAVSGSLGNAGNVVIEVVGRIELLGNAAISNSTSVNTKDENKGHAGDVMITAHELLMDGSDAMIRANARKGSTGSAGKIEIVVSDIQLLNGSEIRSSTEGRGNAGAVTVNTGRLTMDGRSHINNAAGPGSTGDAGIVKIRVSDSMTVSNNSIIVTSTIEDASGKGGIIDIEVKELMQILSGSQINAYTESKGNAGDISVTAGNLTIDGQEDESSTGITSAASEGSTGTAGMVKVTVPGTLRLFNGGYISSPTAGTKDAGDILVEAGHIAIAGRNIKRDSASGIFSQVATESSEGNAGSITVLVHGIMEVLDGGVVSASTYSEGNAGYINITADKLIIDTQGSQYHTGVASHAAIESNGHTGNVLINAGSINLNGYNSIITIAAEPFLSGAKLENLPDTTLTINADKLTLDRGSLILVESLGNVPASSLNLQTKQLAVRNNSQISTQSRYTNAGAINITGNVVYLQDSRITTSAVGPIGDGGDVTFQGFQADAPVYLVMNGGFIQANTAAEGAKGGDINLALRGILVEKNSGPLKGYKKDEVERYEFLPGAGVNIIQAAAPEGNPGAINIDDAPELDISGDIVQVHSHLIESATLAIDPCELALAWETASSLVQGTREGLPLWPGAYSGVVFDKEMLEDLLQ